jgi:hypothetical protein
MSVGVRIAGAGRVTLQDVAIIGVGVGIEAHGAAVRAQGLTVSGCVGDGVALEDGSSGIVSSFHIRGNGGIGLVARSSSLSAAEGMLVANQGGGVVLLGASPGDIDRIDRLVAMSNTIVGIGAVNPLATATPRTLEITLSSVSDTRTSSRAGSGYGAYFGAGIDAHLDRSISSDAHRGHGSEFVLNWRAGMLVSGARTTLDLHGARVSSNDGPGLMIQNGATASRVGFSEFVDDLGVGVIVTSGSRLAYFECDESSEIRQGAIVFTSRAATFGDGLLLAPGGPAPMSSQLSGNLLNDSGRFGAYFVGASVSINAGNTATGNRAGPGGRDDETLVTGAVGLFPLNPNLPAGTNLPRATDTLEEVVLR